MVGDSQTEASILLKTVQIFMFGKYTMYLHRQHFEATLQAKQLIQGSQVGAWVTKHTGIHMYIYMCVCRFICLPAYRSIFRYMGSIVKTRKHVNMKEKQAYMCRASSGFHSSVRNGCGITPVLLWDF